MKKLQLSLRDWIDGVGTSEVAKLLKVDKSAVHLWRKGTILPRYYHMVSIYKYSRGRVSYATMIEDATRMRARRKREASV